MQLVIATRGVKHDVERFITMLQGIWLPYQNQGQQQVLQFGVRPVQLWELAFPEQHLQTIMRTLWDESMPEYSSTKFKLPLAALRKILKLKKVPELDVKHPVKLPIYKMNVGIHPVGIHEDEVKTERI